MPRLSAVGISGLQAGEDVNVEVRKPTQRCAHIRGVWREHIRKNPNRAWLGFEYWWPGALPKSLC